jgi:hypothetical protein
VMIYDDLKYLFDKKIGKKTGVNSNTLTELQNP